MSYADPNPPQVIQAETVERMSYPHPAFKPMAVPRDLVDRLKAIHGYPFIWFIGQFLHYLMRPSDELRTYIETSQERMGIRHPIVGYVGKGGGGGRRGEGGRNTDILWGCMNISMGGAVTPSVYPRCAQAELADMSGCSTWKEK